VKSNGDVPAPAVTVPDPLDTIVTNVALPPNVLPLMVTGDMPQVLPLILLSVSAGPFGHPHDTSKLVPVVEHPDAVFKTVIVWLPFETGVKVVPT
jgi:hypothetical protein